MKTDPRTGTICLMLFIVCVFISDSFLALTFDFSVLILSFLLSSASFCNALKALWKTAFLIVLSAVLCMFSNSVKAGIILFARLCLVVSASSVFTQKTSIKQLSDSLERIFHSRSLAAVITITVRFIPLLFEEANRIKDSQSLRGAKFAGVKSLIPLAVPMFQNAFRRAGNLGTAMEARGYDLNCRKTKMNVLKYSLTDYVIFAFSLAFLCALVYIRRLNLGL